MDNEQLDQFSIENESQQDLQGAGGILAMGIISIPFFGGFIGLILAIITLTRSGAELKKVKAQPGKYTEKSIKKVRAGRICAIISLSLLGAAILIIAIMAGANS